MIRKYAVTIRFTVPYGSAATDRVIVHASCVDNARTLARLEIPGGSYNVRILAVEEVR